MKKKILALGMGLCLVMGVTACSSSEKKNEPKAEEQITEAEEVTSDNEEQITEEAELVNGIFDEVMSGAKYELSEEEITTLENYKANVSESSLEGNWNRTNCMNGESGTIEISMKSDTEFDYSGGFSGFAAMGSTEEGEAKGYFLCENRGIVIENEFLKDEEMGAIFFLEETDGTLKVAQIGNGYGFGMGVTASGEYTQDEPVYTNEHIMEETFDVNTQNDIKELLEANNIDVENYFETPVKYGVLDITEDCEVEFEDGSTKQGTWYEGRVPHDSFYSFTMFRSEDGSIYYEIYSGEVQFATNDPDVYSMPVEQEK